MRRESLEYDRHEHSTDVAYRSARHPASLGLLQTQSRKKENPVSYRMISADDHIDLGYLPRDLWIERLPKSLRERAPHVEDRGEKGEFWVCDGETWADYRGERWFAKSNRTRLALDRGGVGEAHRPTTPEKRLTDMDRDGVEASLMFPPIIAMQVGDAELRNA